MTTTARTHRWREPALALLAAAALNALLSFRNLWPTPWIRPSPQIAPEALVLILTLGLLLAWRGTLTRAIHWGLTVALLLLAAGRYLEVTAPALYGRQINLYWDLQHLPAVAGMLAGAAAPWQLALVLVLAALVLLGLVLGMHWLIGALASGLGRPRARRWWMGLAGLLFLLAGAGHWVRELPTRHWFAPAVTPTYVEQIAFVIEALRPGTPETLQAPPLPSANLAALEGADVLLVFIESYGAITLDRPELVAGLEPSRRRLAAAIAATGRQVVSARVTSPTFGSGSWLAHASLLAGVPVTESGRYARLLTQDRATLVHRFAEQGYRVVGLMPGIRQAWPEGAFYGFDQIHDAAGLDYQGPAFGWWRIPDQFALARLDERELANPERGSAPVFVVFPTISSHAPFRPVAPYQPDWPAVLSDTPYPAAPLARQLASKPDWSNLTPSYRDALDYSLTSIAGFLEWQAERHLLVILIGDHQPPSSVSGPDSDWDVPVHLITDRPAIAAALVTHLGFTPGMTPTKTPIGPMDQLTAGLLDAFSRP